MAADMLRDPIVFEVPGMASNCSSQEVVYKTVAGLALKMMIYIPEHLSVGTIAPGIIFIHGGPFPPTLPLLPTEWGQYTSLGQLAAAYGMIGITFHHRYHELGMIEEAAQDIEDAILFAREHAEEYQLDRDRLCLWAISGGGPFISGSLRNTPEYLKCLVAHYTRLDMRQLEATQQELGEDVLHRFSPVAVLEDTGALTIPTFLARAGLDKPDLNQSIDQFIQTALSLNAPIDICNHDIGRHAFDILDDCPRSREILQKSMEFVQYHLNEGSSP